MTLPDDLSSPLDGATMHMVLLTATQVALLATYHFQKANEGVPLGVSDAHRAEALRLSQLVVAMTVAETVAPDPEPSPAPQVSLTAQELAYVGDGYLRSAMTVQEGGDHAHGFLLHRRGLELRAEAQRRDPALVLEPVEATPLAVAGSA